MRKIIFIAGLVTMSLTGTGYAMAQGMGAAGGTGQGGAGMNSSSGMSSSGGMGSGAGMTSGNGMRATGGMSAGGMRSTSDADMQMRTTRSNRGGTMRGVDRANSVAGTNGMRGRTNAMTRQTTSGGMTRDMDRTQTGSVTTRSNPGGAVRGLDRADAVAGTNGMKGRTNARMRQMTE